MRSGRIRSFDGQNEKSEKTGAIHKFHRTATALKHIIYKSKPTFIYNEITMNLLKARKKKTKKNTDRGMSK